MQNRKLECIGGPLDGDFRWVDMEKVKGPIWSKVLGGIRLVADPTIPRGHLYCVEEPRHRAPHLRHVGEV